MSLKPDNKYQIPELTSKVAKAVFPNGGNIFMKIRDECGVIYNDEDFADLFAAQGKPAEAPGRLALVTIIQFAEGMTDREAADAVRSRIDLKYALGLDLEDAGFHYSVLSKFRRRLLAGSAEERLLDRILAALAEKELLPAGGKQRTDSTHILGAIRTLNRLELVGETLRHALNSLAMIVPDWLQSWVSEEWFEAYGEPVNGYRLPKEQTDRAQLALAIGQDGLLLLSTIHLTPEYQWLSQVPAIQILRQVWWQQYGYDENGSWRWRTAKETPPASVRIVSPYDPQARQGKKRETNWLGYKVHLTETCNPQMPKLITNVETRIACQQDYMATEDIHQALAERDRLPEQHVVDTAYVSGAHIVTSQESYGLDLLGPVLPDTSWQAQDPEAHDLARFRMNWEEEKAICPQRHASMSWNPTTDKHGKPIIKIHFSLKHCGPCGDKKICTSSKTHGRQLAVRPQAEHEAIQSRRQYMETDAFREDYALRAGVEGVISQAAYALNGRRSRYRGLAKTHLQNLVTAAAINLRRSASWLLGQETAATSISRFAALAPA